jgi:hypothetical protein
MLAAGYNLLEMARFFETLGAEMGAAPGRTVWMRGLLHTLG